MIPDGMEMRNGGEPVAQTETLIVEYPGQLPCDLWVFVVPAESGRYYPQSSDVCQGKSIPGGGGEWEMRIGFGIPDDTGDLYDIVLAVARTQLEKQFITGKVIAWCRNDFIPVLSSCLKSSAKYTVLIKSCGQPSTGEQHLLSQTYNYGEKWISGGSPTIKW